MGDDSSNILEFGAGTGKLALDLLLELEKLERLPKHYFILEVSGELQKRQKELFEKFAPHLLSRVDWLGHLPQTTQCGHESDGALSILRKRSTNVAN